VTVAEVQMLIATAARSAHISGTLHRDLPRTVENRRDLSRKSDHMSGAFAMIRETLAQDPAYRPTGSPLAGHTSYW
jgi:hypothetical protein